MTDFQKQTGKAICLGTLKLVPGWWNGQIMTTTVVQIQITLKIVFFINY